MGELEGQESWWRKREGGDEREMGQLAPSDRRGRGVEGVACASSRLWDAKRWEGGRESSLFCGGERPADGLLQTIEQGQMQLQRCSHTEASAALVLECTSTQQDMMEVLQCHIDDHSFSKRAIISSREAGRRS